jgi:hypothetical protein
MPDVAKPMAKIWYLHATASGEGNLNDNIVKPFGERALSAVPVRPCGKNRNNSEHRKDIYE